MTQSLETKKIYHEVFSISEYEKDGEVKHSWLRLGVAFQNKDHSFNILLRALPIPDPKSGLVRLHMRLPLASSETPQVIDAAIDAFNEPFQVFEIPLNEL